MPYPNCENCICNIKLMRDELRASGKTSAREICKELGRSVTTFTDIAARKGRCNISFVNDIINKYYPTDKGAYMRFIVDDEGRANYEWRYFANAPRPHEQNVVAVNFAKMETCAAAMKLNMRSLSRAFGYDGVYYETAKACGEIDLNFVVKFCELTDNKVQDFEKPKPAPIQSAGGDYSENLKDIDAVLVSILKTVQAINRKLDKLEGGRND